MRFCNRGVYHSGTCYTISYATLFWGTFANGGMLRLDAVGCPGELSKQLWYGTERWRVDIPAAGQDRNGWLNALSSGVKKHDLHVANCHSPSMRLQTMFDVEPFLVPTAYPRVQGKCLPTFDCAMVANHLRTKNSGTPLPQHPSTQTAADSHVPTAAIRAGARPTRRLARCWHETMPVGST